MSDENKPIENAQSPVQPAQEATTPQPTTEVSNSPVNVAPVSQAPKKRNMLLLIPLLLGGCLLLCGGLIAVFGYVEIDEECKYEGPLSPEGEICGKEDEENNDNSDRENDESEDSDDSQEDSDREGSEQEDEENNDRNSTSEDGVYETENFSIEYPEEWVLDEGLTITYIYSVDPTKAEKGKFIDNMNILSTTFGFDEVSELECQQIADEGTSAASSSYDEFEIVSADLEEINDITVCHIEVEASIQDIPLDLDQYIFFTENEVTESYIFTTISDTSSGNSRKMEEIVESFELN